MALTTTEMLKKAALAAWGTWPWVPAAMVRELTGREDGERSLYQVAILLGCDGEQAQKYERSLYLVTAVAARSVCARCAKYEEAGCVPAYKDAVCMNAAADGP